MPETTSPADAAAAAIADTVTPADNDYPGESESQQLIRELIDRLERLERHVHGEGGERIIRE